MAGTLVANTINTDTGLFSTNNAYLGVAKAWVQFQGGQPYGTAGVINGSFNVSSITVNGTGDYTINFTTAFADTYYSAVGSTQYDDATSMLTLTWRTLSTSSVRAKIEPVNGSLSNTTTVHAVLFHS